MKSPAELSDLFRAQGLKVTPQRQCIFGILHRNETHPTAEAVHEAVRAEMPTVSLRTVYQTLHDLASMGELVQIDLGTGATRFDPNLDDHHHLVCDRCGDVTDVPGDPTAIRLPDTSGFQVVTTQIVFRGLCAACASDPAAHHPSETDPGSDRNQGATHA